MPAPLDEQLARRVDACRKAGLDVTAVVFRRGGEIELRTKPLDTPSVPRPLSWPT
jgi:hypothetical protein